MTSIPLSNPTVHLKYIDVETLDLKAAAALEIGFGRFFSEEEVNDFRLGSWESRAESLAEAGIESIGEEPFRYRRFAGDSSLPRGRYFSLCDSTDGDDHRTLLHELLAYTNHESCGRFEVSDSLRSIDLSFVHDEEGPSPLVERLASAGVLAKTDLVRVTVPCAVRREQVKGTLDLREPTVQDWIYERLKAGIDRVAYEYDGGISGRLVVTGGRPRGVDVDSRLWNPDESDTVKSFPPCDSWDLRVFDGPDNFLGLLPYLIFGTNGGSPITDAIGRWLRHQGVQALVFPSARNDVSCEILGGRLQRTTGWNLVDYRGAPEANQLPVLIVAPDSWRFAGERALHGAAGVEMERYDVQADPPGQSSEGSWRIADQAEQLRRWFQDHQQMTFAGRRAAELLRQQLVESEIETSGDDPAPQVTPTVQSTADVPVSEQELRHFITPREAAQQATAPTQEISALLALHDYVRANRAGLAAHPIAGDMGILPIELFEWEVAFTLGARYLFRYQGDPESNVEEAIHWLRMALRTPVRELSPVDWARTQGELATAYKHRPSGTIEERRSNAMDCLDRAMEVFSPGRYRVEWLATLKQRALLRLELPSLPGDFTSGEQIEVAVAELQFVTEQMDRREEFELWSSAMVALAASLTRRHLGYFITNTERARETLLDVLAETGDLETLMARGATMERLRSAAAASLQLATTYQIRRQGDYEANRMEAVHLLTSARRFYNATSNDGAVMEIDERLTALGPSSP